MLPMQSAPAGALQAEASTRLVAESCAQIKHLGYVTSKHIHMYGERFEIVSEPFSEGDCVVVRAVSENDPTIRTLHLPVAILVGLKNQLRKS